MQLDCLSEVKTKFIVHWSWLHECRNVSIDINSIFGHGSIELSSIPVNKILSFTWNVRRSCHHHWLVGLTMETIPSCSPYFLVYRLEYLCQNK